jgi:hypothetical protein
MHPAKSFLLLLLLTALPSCHQLTNVPGEPWTRTDLYFGLTRMDKSAISDADFQKFVDNTITPLFHDGFTITPATGQYLDSKRVLHKEPSRVLTLMYPRKDGQSAAAKINYIARQYCQDFNQESVLRSDTPATVWFLNRHISPQREPAPANRTTESSLPAPAAR